MNITDSIAKQIGGKVEKIIVENPQIQFYANDAINAYQWRDSRYMSSADVWENGEEKTRKDLIDAFLIHLKFLKQ
ncbi:MAG: hypothetical protein KBC56_04915 [Flavobacterium sp.]|nr:hypothetical protein [Flavobacterium sp.]